jgi:hypothetical protein
MNQERTITYSFLPGVWDMLSRPPAAAAADQYWTLRAYGLEGTVQIPTDQGDVRWGGFILDLACGLAEWAADPKQSRKISPAEQSNDVIVGVFGNRVRIVSGGQTGELDQSAAVTMIDGWLTAIAKDLETNAPRVLEVAGFEWAADRAWPSTG